ncbi:MAG: MBL fold metallo-hydrolase [Firmicutes bacterium]|nr:MBL fold metallo-hydrolase [Bacillota bacterium]
MNNKIKVEAVVGHIDSNTFVVEENGTIVLIDAGAPLNDVKKALGKRKPSAILLTHEHFDHVYHIDYYKKEFACPIFSPTSEDEIVVEKMVIKPILAPGHSPKSVVYLIGDSLFTGDVLFAMGIGRTDFPESNPREMQKTLNRLLGIKFVTAYHGHYEPSSYAQQQINIRRYIE